MSIARKKLGTINCLVNNAALFEKDDITNFTTKSWNDHLNINLLAPTILTKQFAKQASKKTVSNIINIIDQRIFNLTPFFMSYTISKSGLQTLTKTMAMRLGPNIKVNAIAPGPTIKSKRQADKHFRNQVRSTLLKKSVKAEDICDAVEFLISNNSITGQIIAVDSGQNLSWNRINEKE
jgi:NAD(P)-dependent dehydrogenase (short-subunit alcohol dehydrogenase family)